jgi:hypothetical protein
MKKNLIATLLVFIGVSVKAQNKIVFEYDTAGNQIKREICINCTNPAAKTPKEVTNIKPEDLQKSFPDDVISYYPNPIKEELYLKWDLVNKASVTRASIYSLQGQEVKSYTKLDNTNSLIIPFQAMPNGVYTIILGYTDGEQKSIKIIKQ